jgi:hypothetical protein
LKADGTPDERFKENKDATAASSPNENLHEVASSSEQG